MVLCRRVDGYLHFFYAPWTFVRHYYAGKAGHRAIFDLRCDLYYHILRLSASFFSRNRSGGIVSRLIGDIAQAQNLVGTALTNVWMDSVSLLVVLYFMFNIDVKTALVALATFPPYLFCFRRLGDRIKESSREVQKEMESLSGSVTEKIAGSIIVRAFAHEKREEKVFHADSEKLYKSNMRTVYFQSLNVVFTNTLIALAPLVVTLYGGWRVIAGRLSVGDLIAIGMYLGPLYLPLQRFSELNVIFANAMAALERIFEIMDFKPEIVDKPNAIELPTAQGKIEFIDVHFGYEPHIQVLKGISFVAEPGQKVALVGRSGSGKSTVASLIPRFYDVDAGSVRVDGHDVRDLQLKSLRRHIGMVLQDPILFSGTIRDNILYGNAKADDKSLLDACRAANVLEFIEELPEGWLTEVGERGCQLSGGQKQRITIARAFLRNPRILILDEATSALDTESERLIQDALSRLMAGRTVIIIAHRLSTVAAADLILVLDGGHIVERGTHEELLARKGLYRELYSCQKAI